MANNYTETSSWLNLKPDQITKAKEIIDRVELELEEDDSLGGYCGIIVEVEGRGEKPGVWFHGDESANVEHLAVIARALIEELEIDEPFLCSWSYTCSKPRIDEFGGGAFAIIRGKETHWVDAMCNVQDWAEKERKS